MHRRSVAVYDHFLGALSAILTRAEAHCTAREIAPEALLQARLFPDMYPLIRQVQLACDFAARGAARLAGEAPRPFPDTETTFAELQDRISAARSYITAFPVEAFQGAETREITLRMGGRDRTIQGEDFLDGYSLPQFHFHLTTAYALLRHNGLELAKRDYLGAQ